MKPGDLAWHRQWRELVMILEVRYLHGLPQWVQILTADGFSWTVASQLEVLNQVL